MISAASLRAVFIRITSSGAISKRYVSFEISSGIGNGLGWIREATCDENPEQSYKLIQVNPKEPKRSFWKKCR